MFQNHFKTVTQCHCADMNGSQGEIDSRYIISKHYQHFNSELCRNQTSIRLAAQLVKAKLLNIEIEYCIASKHNRV